MSLVKPWWKWYHAKRRRWVPTNLPGCVERYLTNMGLTGTPGIARWLNLSGQFDYFAQTTAVRKPAASGAALAFTSPDSLFRGAVVALTNGYTIGIALQYRTLVGASQRLFVNSNTVASGMVLSANAGDVREQDHPSVGAVQWGAATTDPETWVARHDGAGASADFCLDGAHQTPQALGNNAAPGGQCAVGGYGGSLGSNVDIWAVVAYSTRLNDVDTVLLSTYLTNLRNGTPSGSPPGTPVLWLERPDLNAGQAVNAFANQGEAGAARDLAQATATKQPVLIPWDPTIRHSFLHFDGADDYLRGTWTQAQPVHRFGALLPTDSAVANAVPWDGGPAYSQQLYCHADGITLIGYAGTGLNKTGTTVDDWHRVEVGYNGASSRIRVDDLAPVAGNIGAGAPNGLTLGRRGSASAQYADTRIVEIIGYNRILSGLEQQQVHDYFTARYGI